MKTVISKPLPDLTPEQWEFLSILDAFRGPVPTAIIDKLQPLAPGPLLELAESNEGVQLIRHHRNAIEIGDNTSSAFRQHLESYNTPTQLNGILDRIRSLNLLDKIPGETLADLLLRAEKEEEAAQLHLEIAEQMLSQRDSNGAMDHYQQGLNLLTNQLGEPRSDRSYVSNTLVLSNLSMAQGRILPTLCTYLLTALDVTARLGDARSAAMLKLHLGRYYFLTNHRNEALECFETGRTEITMIGDGNILEDAAEFIGLHFYMQGRFIDALVHLERAARSFETRDDRLPVNVSGPILLGYCTAYLSLFDRSIGYLDYMWRLTNQRSETAFAIMIRAILGTVLLLIKKRRRGAFHLTSAYRDAKAGDNDIACHLAAGGLAYYHFLDDRLDEAWNWLSLMQTEWQNKGWGRRFACPGFWRWCLTWRLEDLNLSPASPSVSKRKTCQGTRTFTTTG